MRQEGRTRARHVRVWALARVGRSLRPTSVRARTPRCLRVLSWTGEFTSQLALALTRSVARTVTARAQIRLPLHLHPCLATTHMHAQAGAEIAPCAR